MTNDKGVCTKKGEKCASIPCCGPEDAGGEVLECTGKRKNIYHVTYSLECVCHENCGGKNIEFLLTQDHI